MKIAAAAILIILYSSGLYAFTVSGRIIDGKTGKAVSDVSVAIDEIRTVKITSQDGAFAFEKIPAGYYTIHTAHPLYGNKEVSIRVKREFIIEIALSEKIHDISPVIYSMKQTESRPGKQSITSDDIRYMPMSGTGDSLRLLQTLPGVGTSFMMSSVPVIRGLNPVYDKIYIDDIAVDYPSHYLPPVVPLMSSINETIIDEVTVSKTIYPVIYDDSLGSIIQVKTKEVQQPGVHGRIILNPVVPLFPTVYSEASPTADFSMIFAGRRSYIDWAYDAAAVDPDNTFYFQDHYVKLRYNLFSKHRFYFTSIGSDDYISTDDIEAGNEYHIEAVKWQYLYNRHIFLETSLVRNKINHFFKDEDAKSNEIPAEVSLHPLTYSLKQTLSADLKFFDIKTGYEYTIHRDGVGGNIDLSDFVDYDISKETEGDEEKLFYPIEGKTFSVFNETGIDLKNVHLNLGARYKYYGPLKSNSISYRGMASYMLKNQGLKLYAGGGSYRAQPDMYYYLGDYGGRLKEARSASGVAGFEKKLTDGITGQVEAYYSRYEDLFSSELGTVSSTELRRLSQINPYSGDNSGQSYGAEFFIKGRLGKFYGWSSYSLSRARMTDGDDEYNSDYDQTHIFRVSVLTQLGRWTPSAVWHYYTSMPYTPVTGANPDGDGNYDPVYGGYNSKRYSSIHRLDAKLTYTTDSIRFYVEVWNLYYVYGYDRDDDEFKTNESNIFPVFDRDKPFSSSNPDNRRDLPPALLWAGVEICF